MSDRSPDTDQRLIRLAEGDNVVMIATTLREGDTVNLSGANITVRTQLSLGHKLAAHDIRAGDTITKYNFPIGIATEDIALGEHVHVHNVRSDYTPSYVVPEPIQ